jgi:hypothetical protein
MSRHPDVPAKLYAFLACRMKYSAPLKVLQEISVDMYVTLLVVGDPDNACYEWVIVSNDDAPKPRPTQYSNLGYGMSCDALRDGLIAYHGLPSAFHDLRKRLMSAPPAGASKERVLSHYADLVGEAIKVIDAAGEQP